MTVKKAKETLPDLRDGIFRAPVPDVQPIAATNVKAPAIQWQDCTEVLRFAPPSPDHVQAFLAGAQPADAAILIVGAGLQPLVAIDEECSSRIYTHLQAHDVEAGGLLMGHIHGHRDNPDRPAIVHVTHNVIADGEGTAVSIRMSSKVWSDAGRLRDEKGLFVLGWYHSHPGLGAFFSGTDRKTQANHFNHPYSLGLVVDPIRDEEIWFLGPQSEKLLYAPLRLSRRKASTVPKIASPARPPPKS